MLTGLPSCAAAASMASALPPAHLHAGSLIHPQVVLTAAHVSSQPAAICCSAATAASLPPPPGLRDLAGACAARPPASCRPPLASCSAPLRSSALLLLQCAVLYSAMVVRCGGYHLTADDPSLYQQTTMAGKAEHPQYKRYWAASGVTTDFMNNVGAVLRHAGRAGCSWPALAVWKQADQAAAGPAVLPAQRCCRSRCCGLRPPAAPCRTWR